VERKYTNIKAKNVRFNTSCEIKIEKILLKNNINYEKQWVVYDRKNKRCRFYDFYLPDFNILLEVDGCYWHCKPSKYSAEYIHPYMKTTAEEIWKRDKYKNFVAKDNGYKIVRVWEDEIDEKWTIY